MREQAPCPRCQTPCHWAICGWYCPCCGWDDIDVTRNPRFDAEYDRLHYDRSTEDHPLLGVHGDVLDKVVSVIAVIIIAVTVVAVLLAVAWAIASYIMFAGELFTGGQKMTPPHERTP